MILTEWISLAGPVSSVLIAFFVSVWLAYRRERRREKLENLGKIMGNRHALTSRAFPDAEAKFFEALNTAFAVYHDSPPVKVALQDIKKYPHRAGDNVTQLIRRMTEDLGIDLSDLEDHFFDTPFAPAERRGAA